MPHRRMAPWLTGLQAVLWSVAFAFPSLCLGQGSGLVLKTPASQECKERMNFTWNFSGNATHFLVRVVGDPKGKAKMLTKEEIKKNTVWVSERIPGAKNQYSDKNVATKMTGHRFCWIVEAYDGKKLLASEIQPFDVLTGFSCWLKGMLEIRHPVQPHFPLGKLTSTDSIAFSWSYPMDPGHFLIHVREEADDPTEEKKKPLWTSPKIAGDKRSYEATDVKLDRAPAKRYSWEIEAYDERPGVAPIPTGRGKQSFGFLSPKQAAGVAETERRLLQMLAERPSDQHLLLILGAYYGDQSLFGRSAEAFGLFLGVDPPSMTYKSLTTGLVERLQESHATRARLEVRLDQLKSNESRVAATTRLLALSQLLLDYKAASQYVDELEKLAKQANVRDHEWQSTRKRFDAEKKIVQQLFL